MKEIWKDVKGFEGIYQVSNLGNVRSLDRYVSNNSFRKGKILKGVKVSSGYLSVDLLSESKAKRVLIHRLIAISFIDNLENKPCVNHINGIKTDNRVENLEWCTYTENNKHAINIGLNKKDGIYNYLSKFTEDDIKIIRNLSYTNKELREKYNVSEVCINQIRRRKTYKNII